ncbi:MAG: hypothetical protein WAL47_14975, partial [Pyrinomonadaceae bacterium]
MFKIQKTFIESCLMILVLTTLFFVLSVSASGQESEDPQSTDSAVASRNERGETHQPNVPIATAPYKDFMGVTIGMKANQVREKLGHLKIKGEHQDFFVFSESQSAQIYYDQGEVRAISVDYVVKGGGAPTPESVLGESVQAKPDGSIYQLKRYPAAGYWVAYSMTAG